MIFFSSTSSSAKFFWYFSQLEPVAEGMLTLQAAVAEGMQRVVYDVRFTEGKGVDPARMCSGRVDGGLERRCVG